MLTPTLPACARGRRVGYLPYSGTTSTFSCPFVPKIKCQNENETSLDFTSQDLKDVANYIDDYNRETDSGIKQELSRADRRKQDANRIRPRHSLVKILMEGRDELIKPQPFRGVRRKKKSRSQRIRRTRSQRKSRRRK